MRPFSLLIALEVFDFVSMQSRRMQWELRMRMLLIRDFPHNHSDFLEPDSSGRAFNVHLFGRYAIKYWIDHADQQVKIMEISLSDR